MSEEIIKILDYIGQQLGIAIDWTAENAWPQVLDIFGRYRLLNLIGNSMWLVAGICIMIVFAVLWIKVLKSRSVCEKEHASNFWWVYRSYGISMDGAFGLLMFTILGCVISFLIFYVCIPEFLEWLIVPEVQFLELLKGYVQ